MQPAVPAVRTPIHHRGRMHADRFFAYGSSACLMIGLMVPVSLDNQESRKNVSPIEATGIPSVVSFLVLLANFREGRGNPLAPT